MVGCLIECVIGVGPGSGASASVLDDFAHESWKNLCTLLLSNPHSIVFAQLRRVQDRMTRHPLTRRRMKNAWRKK